MLEKSRNAVFSESEKQCYNIAGGEGIIPVGGGRWGVGEGGMGVGNWCGSRAFDTILWLHRTDQTKHIVFGMNCS